MDNGLFSYSIVGGNEEGFFQINIEDGTISISSAAAFDVDVQDTYNITVAATDAPGLNTTAEVLVQVFDSNDNQPQILSPRGVNLSLSEDTPPGLVILDSINATDEDHGLNAVLEFLIVSGDATNSFSIDPLSGKLVLSAPLDRESGTGELVNLTIAARDHGIPFLQDTINVVIFIEDVNDFAPVFTQGSYEEHVGEGVPIGYTVLRIRANDGDEGPGGVVTYSLVEGAEEKFVCDPQTGVITTNGSIDREEKEVYRLVVLAVDNPLNTSLQLSTLVNVTIVIDDFNDNAPEFNRSFYEIDILDDLRRGAEVIQVIASDRDTGSNAEITYQFVSPLPDNADRFVIDSDTGLVEVYGRPRIDIQTEYRYVIRALDGGSPVRQTDVDLTIFIHDVNENAPTFDQDSYNTTISEKTDIGTFVLQVCKIIYILSPLKKDTINSMAQERFG